MRGASLRTSIKLRQSNHITMSTNGGRVTRQSAGASTSTHLSSSTKPTPAQRKCATRSPMLKTHTDPNFKRVSFFFSPTLYTLLGALFPFTMCQSGALPLSPVTRAPTATFSPQTTTAPACSNLSVSPNWTDRSIAPRTVYPCRCLAPAPCPLLHTLPHRQSTCPLLRRCTIITVLYLNPHYAPFGFP